MSILPSELSHFFMLAVAGLFFHGVLWARNAAFLWCHRGVILRVILSSTLYTNSTLPS
jgi:hypothetical protein